MYFILKIHFFICICLLVFSSCMRTSSNLERIRVENADSDWNRLMMNEPPINDIPLTLDQILCIVLERNLDLLVKEKEYEYQYELATGAKLKMIPPLVMTGEISGRDRNTGMSSQSLVPGIPPAPPSISQDEHVNRRDLTFTWNLLDFGISYYRARQAADKAIITEMEYLRLRQRLIQDTVEAYWKAQAAMLGLTESQNLIIEANQFMTFINTQIKNQVVSKDKALSQEKQILRQEVQIQLYEKEYHKAMLDLAKLMGYPFASFALLPEETGEIDIELPSTEVLEQLALQNRPELFGLDMQDISVINEAKVALLQIFPSLSLFAGRFNDTNSFLIFNHWIVAGLRYSWNLLAIPYHMQDFLSELQHHKAVEYERLAVSIGILTQVNLAWLEYQDTKQEYRLVEQLADVNKEILQAAKMREEVGEISALELLIDYKYDALLSKVEALRAYGYLKSAIEQINTSIGIPFYLEGCKVEDND